MNIENIINELFKSIPYSKKTKPNKKQNKNFIWKRIQLKQREANPPRKHNNNTKKLWNTRKSRHTSRIHKRRNKKMGRSNEHND